MQAALVIQSVVPVHRRRAQQGTQQRAHGDVRSVGRRGSGPSHWLGWHPTACLGAVRERGSRVVRRTTAAAAEEPKPLPVFLRAVKINHGMEAMMAALG